MPEVLNTLIAEIRERHRVRVDFHRAEKRLTNQIKGICRRFCEGDKKRGRELYKHVLSPNGDRNADEARGYLLPFLSARDLVGKRRLEPEREMRKLARRLPAWEWVESVNGFGPLGFAQIIAEAGDLANYPDKSKLWKRMGLAVIGGRRQRKVKGAGALEHGYSPQRRSVMWNIGAALWKKKGPYRDLYLRRKEYEKAKLPEPDGFKLIWHRRAQRYIEKKLLRDLRREWRSQPEYERTDAS